MELNETVQCCTTLDMLYRHPHIARHVQELAVRQERSQELPKTVTSISPHGLSYADPSCVCVAVKRVAIGLDALRSFVWGGHDYPLDDDIWLVLRKSCVSFSLPCLLRMCSTWF